MDRRLHLQGCACGHGGSAWVALPATIHYSVAESSRCPPGIGREFFGRAVSAAGARAIFVIFTASVIPSEVEAATQPPKLSGRGQAFNPVVIVYDSATGSLDSALLRSG